jgi:hypothetical protein
MDTIEVTDRHHGAGKRATIDAMRTTARDVELLHRHAGTGVVIGNPE